MSQQLIFATQNPNKVKEIRHALKDRFEVQSLDSKGYKEDLPETGHTLEENALQKARFVYGHFGVDCFADDTGLIVYALEGRPGVNSARYAGEEKSAEKNMAKVLAELESHVNRRAEFRTVIALIQNCREFLFEGVIKGSILKKRAGKEGFGYDPVFKPAGYDLSFAQMDLDAKNTLSHRALAVNKLVEFLAKG